MRESLTRNGQHTHTGGDVPEWRAYDAYTVRRTSGPVVVGASRRHWDGVDLALGLLSLGILAGAGFGWCWAWGAVLRPLWQVWWR
jgi:hypothetical protein